MCAFDNRVYSLSTIFKIMKAVHSLILLVSLASFACGINMGDIEDYFDSSFSGDRGSSFSGDRGSSFSGDRGSSMSNFDEEDEYFYGHSLRGRRTYRQKTYPCVSKAQRKICSGRKYSTNCKCHSPPPKNTGDGCGRGYKYLCLRTGCNCYSVTTRSTARSDALAEQRRERMCMRFGGKYCM